jgi:hypothetical protein
MPSAFTGIRFASLALVAASVGVVPEGRAYLSFVWSFAFCHYLIALWYSVPPIRAALANRSGWPWLAGLAAIGFGSFFGGVSLQLYFGIHHALNESFMLDRVTRHRDDPRVRALRGTGFVFHLTTFFCVTGTTTTQYFELWWLWSLPVVGAAYAWTLWRARPALSRRELVDHVLFEAAMIPLAVWIATTGRTLDVYDVALYHFFFWVLFPARSMRRHGASLAPYLAVTVGLLAVFVIFSPVGLIDRHFARGTYRELFFIVSFFHITLSVAISDANPDAINRLFRPRAGGGAGLAPAPLRVQGAGR